MIARISVAAAAIVFAPRIASACPVCFGASDGPILQGSNMGILALLLVTLVMLGAFARFFYTLAKRAAQSDEPAAEMRATAATEGPAR